MITKLCVKNFKCHKNTEIQLSNLNVLTGINGCGKTSLVQPLLLMRQSFQKTRLSEGLELNKPICSVGVGNDVLCKVSDSGDITFEFEDDVNNTYRLVFDCGEKNLDSSFLEKKDYSDNVCPEQLRKLSIFNENFQYVSALRLGGISAFPKDTYAVENQRQISYENGKGELVAHFLFKYGGDKVHNCIEQGKEELVQLLDQVIYWEQKISPNVNLRIESATDFNSFNIRYDFNGDGDNKPIYDLHAENIGFGISYTLPIIVALLSARPGALIVIENPEAHLHPQGQAELSRLITSVASYGVQIIVETHSDHIINGILVALKKDVIKGDIIRIYYFSKDEAQLSQAESLNIDDNGCIRHPPKGFFDQIDSDIRFLAGL